jgi:hypothetical protein
MEGHVIDFDHNVAWQAGGAKPGLPFGAGLVGCRHFHSDRVLPVSGFVLCLV